MWQTHSDAPFKTRCCSLQGKYGFSFLSVYSIGVNMDYDFVTGELPVKLSKCCWFPLGVWRELQGTVERVSGTFSDLPSSSWFRLVAVSKSPAAKRYSFNKSSEPQSVQLCQQSSGLHRNTVTLGKWVALGMWLVPVKSSVVLLEQYPSADCHTTSCMMWGAGTAHLPAGCNLTCWGKAVQRRQGCGRSWAPRWNEGRNLWN